MVLAIFEMFDVDFWQFFVELQGHGISTTKCATKCQIYLLNGVLYCQLVQQIFSQQLTGDCGTINWKAYNVLRNVPTSSTLQPGLQLNRGTPSSGRRLAFNRALTRAVQPGISVTSSASRGFLICQRSCRSNRSQLQICGLPVAAAQRPHHSYGGVLIQSR